MSWTSWDHEVAVDGNRVDSAASEVSVDFSRAIVLDFGPVTWTLAWAAWLMSQGWTCTSLILVAVTVAVESLALDVAWMPCPMYAQSRVGHWLRQGPNYLALRRRVRCQRQCHSRPDPSNLRAVAVESNPTCFAAAGVRVA